MAHSKSFFTVRSGSTKSLTFQNYRGVQITKDRVSSVTNPQSKSQMDQRLLIPMVASARSALKGLVDHSFEGTEYGWRSLQKFSSLNLKKGAISPTAYVPKGAMDPGQANFVVSQGSLPSVTFELRDVDFTLNDTAYFAVMLTNFHTSDYSYTSANPLTIEEVFNIARYGILGTEKTRQMSFLLQRHQGEYTWDNVGTTHKAYRSAFELYRIDNANSLADLQIDVNPSEDYQTDPDGFSVLLTFSNPNSQSEFSLYVEISVTSSTDGKKTYTIKKSIGGAPSPLFALVPKSEDDIFATYAAVIMSQNVDGTWKRSSQRLQPVNPDNVPYGWVIGTYAKSSSESYKFLNNGSDPTFIGGNSGTAYGDDSTDGGDKAQG